MIGEIVSLTSEFSLVFLPYDNIVTLAQTVDDPEVLKQIEQAWKTFIESGQVWAFLIGLFLGYLFRTFIS